MAGYVLPKGIGEQLASRFFCIASESLCLFEDIVGNGYRSFHTSSITDAPPLFADFFAIGNRLSHPSQPSPRPIRNALGHLAVTEQPRRLTRFKLGMACGELLGRGGGVVDGPFRLAARHIGQLFYEAVGHNDIGARRHEGRIFLQFGQHMGLGVIGIEDHQNGFAALDQPVTSRITSADTESPSIKVISGASSWLSIEARSSPGIFTSTPATRPRPEALQRVAKNIRDPPR